MWTIFYYTYHRMQNIEQIYRSTSVQPSDLGTISKTFVEISDSYLFYSVVNVHKKNLDVDHYCHTADHTVQRSVRETVRVFYLNFAYKVLEPFYSPGFVGLVKYDISHSISNIQYLSYSINIPTSNKQCAFIVDF